MIWADAAGIVAPAGTAPRTKTLCCIGSCSKVFTVNAMMQLIEQGKAGLDDPLLRHVPQFRMLSTGYEGITLRMLMNYSSAFPAASIAARSRRHGTRPIRTPFGLATSRYAPCAEVGSAWRGGLGWVPA